MLQAIHTDFFKVSRNDNVMKFSDPTNNLIIRLDKLINDFQRESNWTNRKEFEKHVVPWSADNITNSCELCKARFTFTKRRHHCRLCGSVTCGFCTQFLSFESAKRLTGLEFSSDVLQAISGNATGNDDIITRSGLLDRMSNSKKLDRRRQSASSEKNMAPSSSDKKLIVPSLGLGTSFDMVRNRLGSLMNMNIASQTSEEGSLRICSNCKVHLERREEMMKSRMANPAFMDIYMQLIHLLTKIENLSYSYRKMVESLLTGETIYTLESASELKRKIIAIQQEIITLGEQLETWGTLHREDTHYPTDRTLRLQRNIKLSAITSLHNSINGLPDLPTSVAYEKLKEQYSGTVKSESQIQHRHESTDYKLNESQRLNIFGGAGFLGLRRRMRKSDSGEGRSFNGISESKRWGPQLQQSSSFSGGYDYVDEGWAPTQCSTGHNRLANPLLEEEFGELNPVQEQYLITKSYLNAAAKEGQLDEVKILEKNLKEWEIELKKLDLRIPVRKDP